MTLGSSSAEDLPRWACLWLPLAYLATEIVVSLVHWESWLRYFDGESGIGEIATALLLLPAAYFAVKRGGALWGARAKLSGALLFFYAFACLFLMGEEISYGQHIFQWDSPEYFEANNRQNETNIHNLEFFNRSLLKWLIVVGAVVVGVIAPLIFRRAGAPDFLRRSFLGPLLTASLATAPTALIVLAMQLAVKIANAFNDFEFEENGFISLREATELYIAYFLLLYAWALFRRLDIASQEAR